ncbi:uncharacterized protein PAC_09367 [Phialocephala subalpina]|uniref:Uncharacterized protein n=1 Tax=Phialocephala subalpina TaxID=576137 RepID=A0A1L7X380_9HELO|nr:uncharacterized protein PAC_09367 [Phialocephala subalpina]
MQDALDICIHDNELLLIEHMPNQANRENFNSAHDRLLRDYDPDEGKERFQRHLRLESNNDRYYHALVNYITGMMLRTLLRTMRGALWEERCVVTIAKFAAKLKVLINDLPMSASTCLAKTEEVRFRTKHQEEIQHKIRYNPILDDTVPRTSERNEPQKSQSTQLERGWIDAEMRYFIVMKTFHLGISRLFVSALSNLSSNEDTEMSTDVFDTSVLMYEDYITNRRMFLCSQRDGTIGAAADQRVIASAGAAFQVCLDAWKSLDDVSSDKNVTSEDWTLLSWKWTELDPKSFEPQPGPCTSSLKLSTMKSAINAFVPYSTVCGSFPSLLQDMSNKVSLISDPTAPVKPVKQNPFLAVFTVRTSAYMAKRFDIFNDNDACGISNSVLARGKALARSATAGMPMMYVDENRAVTDKTLRLHRDAERKRMKKAMNEFQRWIIDETSIVISNKLYAWGFLGGSALLVFGGLAIGLSVGDRITGVDPLGLASYCWIFAGFVLLVAKSLRVENWPWSRFFRGQVVCRSVREVHSVTGMDSQDILAILLRLEPRMNLIKRGPFNAVFSKRGTEGFAIDVPFNTSTLIEGGLILVKVQSVAGDALVGIRSDLWTRYDSVSPKGDNATEDKVVCRDFLDPGKWTTRAKEFPLYTLSRGDIQWFRVVGLFEKDAYFD